MLESVNILGIRKRTIVNRSKGEFWIMNGISKSEEAQIDKNKSIVIDNVKLYEDNILLYGIINLNSDEDINYINKIGILPDDYPTNQMHSHVDFTTGQVELIGGSVQYKMCINPIEWFKYHWLLLGKPNRIILYKINKFEL